MRTLIPLALLLSCGCATSSPKAIEAPSTFDSILSQVAGQKLGGADREAFLVRGERGGTPAEPQPGEGFGFDRPLGAHGPSEADVARLLDRRLDLKVPARLACVEAQGQREYVVACAFGGPDVYHERTEWTVRPAAPRSLEAIRKALDPTARSPEEAGEWPEVATPKRAAFASINAVPGLFLPGQGDLGKVRYAAARVGADTLLVYARSTRVYTFRNGLANLYPTLVGLLLPGNERIVVSRVEGAIVDVRSGHVFCVAQGESRVDESSSPLLGSNDDERQEVEQAETEAALAMTRDLARELAALEAAGRFSDRPAEASK
jgi:hypothetical protein